MANPFFSEDKVSEIRERSSIIEVISDYISLKKAGKHYRGLCPFHSEKTPSFMVNEEKQIFHCFGCGAGGDVFTFLMKAGNFSFPQAVTELAKRYGIRLPTRELSPAQKKERDKKEILFQINQAASEYFHDLLTQRKEGEEGRRYLSQRGVAKEIIEEHRLGCSLDRWDGLVQHLREKKLSMEMACELGLILPKKKEGWYDCFRGRVLFPIFDLHQRVVGFGGRVMREGQPKYLNSPESIVYHKGELLYGLSAAKRYIQEKDQVILVEGYFDLLTLHQYGWKNSVATLGTALTPHHILALKRYTKNLVTVFDADEAGMKATLRSLPLFLEQEVWAKTITLPRGEDPDEFLRKGGTEAFEKRSAGAVSVIDIFFDGLIKRHDLKSIDGKVKIAQEGAGLLGKISDKIRRDFYLKALAERLNIRESMLQEVVESSAGGRPKTEEGLKRPRVERGFPKSEELLVRLMIHAPELIPTVAKEEIVTEFESPVLQRVAEALMSAFQKRGKIDLAEILGPLEGEERERLYEFAFQGRDLEGGDREKILSDCVQKIRAKKLSRVREELLRKIRASEREGGEKGLDALLMERQELTRREKGIREDHSRKAQEGL